MDPTAVDLVVTGFKPTTWVGDESAVWDINTTQNWTVNSVKDVYKDGDAILFDASPAGAGPIGVTLNTTVAPFGMTVNGAKDYAFTGSGAIGGNASIAKNGAATLTLGTNNTFTGTTSVNVGTVKIGHANALGTAASALDGTTVATGAALDLNGTAIPAEYLTLGGTGIGGTGALLSSNLITPASTAGPITLTSATTIGGPGGLTLSGAIAQGANLLTLSNTGTATLALSGVMTGSGGLAVGGTGTTTVSSPMTFTGAAGLAVTNTGTTTISGGITGAASNVALSGNGPTTLSGASNLGTGNITVGGSAGEGASPLLPAVIGPVIDTSDAVGAGKPLDPNLPDHTVCLPLRSLAEDLLSETRFLKCLQVKPTPASFPVLQVAGSGSPILLEQALGRGQVFMFTTSAETTWNNMALTPVFPMLMQQIVTYLAGREFERPRTVGDSLSLSFVEQPDASDAVFDTPSGKSITVPVREYRKQYLAMLEKAGEAGFYTARVSVQSPGLPVAVNVDTRESDVACLPDSELKTSLEDTGVMIAATGPELLAAIETARTGRSSWRHFMIAGLVFLLIESLFADRLLRRQQARKVQPEQMPSGSPGTQDA